MKGPAIDRLGPLAAGWAVVGVAALFALATIRLGWRGIDTMRGGLEAGEWTALIVLVIAFAYGEGVVALERRWIPKLVERARRLRRDRRLFVRVLAPLYGLALLGNDRSELIRGWLTTSAIALAVVIVRTFPDPWRGIVDLSVASALAWGLVAIMRRVPGAVRS